MQKIQTINYENVDFMRWTLLNHRNYPTQVGAEREANKLLRRYPGKLISIPMDNKYSLAGDDQFVLAYMR